MLTRVTEITEREEVRDRNGNLLYVEFLVAVLDRDPGDPPAARVIGTEKVRVRPGAAAAQRNVEHVDPVTEQRVDSYVDTSVSIEAVLVRSKSDVRLRVDTRENEAKWPPELRSN